jgi:hypothetical protein
MHLSQLKLGINTLSSLGFGDLMNGIFPFIHSFSIDSDAAVKFSESLLEVSNDSWSPLSFNTVYFGDKDGCKSEASFLTNGDEPFFGSNGEIGLNISNDISAVIEEHVNDYLVDSDIGFTLRSSIYAIRTTKVFESDVWSVHIDGNLMEGLFSVLFCASKESGKVRFNHLGLEHELQCGDGIIYPGGFPYSPQLSGGSGTIYFKTSFR